MDDSIELAVRRAIHTMCEKLGEQLTVEDMARSAMFSKFHFTRVFQRVTGVSPGRFLSALRLQRAKYLLVSTSLNVADISLRVGYNSVGTFSSRFSRSVGMSPTTYRRRAGWASHISTAPAQVPNTQPSGCVFGQVTPSDGQQLGPVFLGLFAERVPEGHPVCCAILPGPGAYRLTSVPPGSWYLLAQSDADNAEPAEPRGQNGGGQVSVATYGPVRVGTDTVLRADVTLRPARDLDPPVLLALLDARKLAVAREQAADRLPSPATIGRPAGALAAAADRTAA
jgi:AraC family transcriptional regulator